MNSPFVYPAFTYSERAHSQHPNYTGPCRVSRLVQTRKEGKMHPDTVMSQPQASPSARRGRLLCAQRAGTAMG